jgi:hypothetical protein
MTPEQKKSNRRMALVLASIAGRFLSWLHGQA